MFKIDTSASYQWPVTIHAPEGGKMVPQTFVAEFMITGRSEVAELLESGEAGWEWKLLSRKLVGWNDIVDRDGQPVPFSQDARDLLINIPFVTNGLISALLESLSGRREKN